MAGNVKVQITGESSGVKRAFKEAEDAATGMGGKFDKLMGSVGKLAVAFGGLYAIKQVGDYMSDAAKDAMEDAKGKEILHTAIRNVIDATDDELEALDSYIEKTQAATGFTEEQLRPAMSKLVGATKDMQQSQDLLNIAMDTSKARGIDLDTVIKAMEKGINGNTGALGKLGIATKDAAGEQLSMSQILSNLEAQYGGTTAAAADTLSGRMERMKLVFGEVKEGIGAALLPVIEKFAQFIMDNMPAIQAIMEGFGAVVGRVLGVLSDVVFPILQTVFEGFTKSVDDKTPGVNTAFEGIGSVAAALQSAFEKIWPAIQQAVQLFVDFLTGPTGQALITGLLEGIGKVLGILSDVFAQVWPLIQSIIQTFIDFFNGPAGQALIKTLLTAIGTALDVLKGVFDRVWPIIQGIVQKFIDFFNSEQGQWLLKTLIEGIGKAIEAFKVIWDKVWIAVGPIVEVAAKAIEKTLGVLMKVLEKVIDAIKWIAEHGGFSTDYENAYNPTHAPVSGGGVQAHAEGGVFTRRHFGMVAEDGPEAIVPLSNPRRAAQVMNQAGLGGNSISVVVNITGQGYAAGQAAADGFLQRLALAGVRL